MKVVSIVPKDICVYVEFSIDQIRKLKKVLDMSQINFNGKDPVETEAKDYVMNELYPMLENVIKEVVENGS